MTLNGWACWELTLISQACKRTNNSKFCLVCPHKPSIILQSDEFTSQEALPPLHSSVFQFVACSGCPLNCNSSRILCLITDPVQNVQGSCVNVGIDFWGWERMHGLDKGALIRIHLPFHQLPRHWSPLWFNGCLRRPLQSVTQPISLFLVRRIQIYQYHRFSYNLPRSLKWLPITSPSALCSSASMLVWKHWRWWHSQCR